MTTPDDKTLDDLVADRYRLMSSAERDELVRHMADAITALRAERDALRKERDALRRFAGECLEPWPECLCDLEGDMQGRLHRAGLIEERIATEPGDDYDIGDSVFFLTDAGKSARAAVAQLREGEGK